MSKYTDARDKLKTGLWLTTPDGPEWIKIQAAIAALDKAEVAEIERNFIDASRRLDDAVAKLRAVVAGTQPNAASQFLDQVNGALDILVPVATNMDALLSGEPATALPGMDETNEPTFPTVAEPIVPPVRELARESPAAAAAVPVTAAKSVDRMIEDILRREGEFVNHEADRGGPTNFGITQKTLAAARGHEVSVDDVRNMTVDEAKSIYLSRYFTHPKIDKLPVLVQPVVFDMSINHGPGTAIKLLQNVLNATGNACAVDGGVGDETIRCAKAAADAVGKALINKLVDRRIALYEAIVARDTSQRVFLKGWLTRANEFRIA